jgi:biopolymer transport protein ExbD
MEPVDVYVVSIDNDGELYLGDAHADRDGAERQLALVRAEYVNRYGADGIEDYGDSDEVIVTDGPTARLHRVTVVPAAQDN